MRMQQYKRLAGVDADAMTRRDPATRESPAIAAGNVLVQRKTKGARAALLAGLIVGALVERGHPDIAERFLQELAKLDR